MIFDSIKNIGNYGCLDSKLQRALEIIQKARTSFSLLYRRVR